MDTRTDRGFRPADRPTLARTERGEWRALASSLALLVAAFGAGWWHAAHAGGPALGWPVAMAYLIALGWLVRAVAGWLRGSTAIMEARELARFRDRQFWSRPARWSYAAILVCDGLFLLEVNPEAHLLFLLLSALAALFAPEVGLLSAVLGAWQLP